ncbi:hypothetical protein [Fodinibacter luteus]
MVEHDTTVRHGPPTLGLDMRAPAFTGHTRLAQPGERHHSIGRLGQVDHVSEAERLVVHGWIVTSWMVPNQGTPGGCGRT